MTPLVLLMAAIVVASNVLVQFPVAGGVLTWGAFTYPFAFLVVDVANRRLGAPAARRVVLWGFAVGILCSLIGSRVELEAGPAVALRVAVASGLAFLLAQMLDVLIFDRLRRAAWWRAPLVSTVASSTLDTAVFFGVAFSLALAPLFPAGANEAVAWAQGPGPLSGRPLWVALALADLGVKLALALAALLPFRALTRARGH